MFSGKLVKAAAILSLPLLALFYVYALEAPPDQAQRDASGQRPIRQFLPTGSTQVPTTVTRHAASDPEARASLRSEPGGAEGAAANALPELGPEATAAIADSLLEELAAGGSLPPEEYSRMQLLVRSVARHAPAELLNDKERMLKMLRSYTEGTKDPEVGAAGEKASGNAEEAPLPANPYEKYSDPQAVANMAATVAEQEDSLNEYLSHTTLPQSDRAPE